jgi:hypothetical protein
MSFSRGSVGPGESSTVNVTVSLPPSRGTSRRGSSDLGRGGRGSSRRNSLDIYTAEYAVRLNNSNRVAAMKQRTAFHMKVRSVVGKIFRLKGTVDTSCAPWIAHISANFRKNSRNDPDAIIIRGRWFTKKTRSNKSRDTAPLKRMCLLRNGFGLLLTCMGGSQSWTMFAGSLLDFQRFSSLFLQIFTTFLQLSEPVWHNNVDIKYIFTPLSSYFSILQQQHTFGQCFPDFSRSAAGIGTFLQLRILASHWLGGFCTLYAKGREKTQVLRDTHSCACDSQSICACVILFLYSNVINQGLQK